MGTLIIVLFGERGHVRLAAPTHQTKHQIMENQKHIVIIGNPVLDKATKRINQVNTNMFSIYSVHFPAADICFFIDKSEQSNEEEYIIDWDLVNEPIIPAKNFIFGNIFEKLLKTYSLSSSTYFLLENSVRKYAYEKCKSNFSDTLLERSMFGARDLDVSEETEESEVSNEETVTHVCSCKRIYVAMFEILLKKYEKVTWILESFGGRTKPYNATLAAFLFHKRVELYWL